jgi:hypothetical protein
MPSSLDRTPIEELQSKSVQFVKRFIQKLDALAIVVEIDSEIPPMNL